MWYWNRQVSKEEEGKQVDSKCHKLTASFQRRRCHNGDTRVAVCSFYEVCVGLFILLNF